MKYYRYGRFSPNDYCSSWGAMVVLFAFAISSYVLDLSLFLTILPLIYSVIWICAILTPHRECFTISDDLITVKIGRKTHKIIIPSELTIILSYADICPPLSTRTAVGNRTHILKDRYAVSILRKMPLDVTLNLLHRNHIRKYTMSWIQTVFDEYYYVYSFVCNQELLDNLLTNRDCLLIVPESISNKISVDLNTVNVHIDKDY